MKAATGHSAAPEPATEAPDVIHLPDLSEPPAAKPKTKGRHYGPRPATDPHNAWMPPWRVTTTLRARIRAEMEAAGLSYSAFMRARFGEKPGPRARRNPGPDTVLLAKLLAELGKSGSNLNQIAYQLNTGEEVQLPELRDALTEHREAVAAVMRALGAR
jgi:hypothetical protein